MASTPSLDDLRIDRSDNRDRARRWPWVVAVLFGGPFPAIRAARLPIVTALREL